MLILTKAMFAMMVGFIIAMILGIILIPILKKLKVKQSLSIYLEKEHRQKSDTPTMGGLIFIIATLVTIVLLLLTNKIHISDNLLIILFVFTGYAFLGFLDDYLIIKRHDNKGLTETQKWIGEIIIALIFFFIFMKSGREPLLWIQTLNIKINLGWFYGVFILLVLTASSNAVNLTDGLDGLAGGLSLIAFIAFGLITWNTGWLAGYEDIAIFCFVLIGSLLGFLIFNVNPAKIFMGDTGSLSLGATLGTIAILTSHEVTLIVIGSVFVIETLSCIIQRLYFKITGGRRIFKMTPIHHHFEKLGWNERDIVKLFWIVGLISAMAAIVFGVWV